MFKKSFFSKENGSITLFVLLAIFFFLIVVFSLFMTSSNKNISQNAEIDKIKEEYEESVDNIDEIYNEALQKEGNIKDIFDAEGDEVGKLHIGDFINYTAGTWTEEEINAIDANNSTDLPSNNFQFGGYTVGHSRDGNATSYSSTYNYVKDESTGEAITGWRLFDVSDDYKTVTLISAGCPEDYYQPPGINNAYICEYILTGNINDNATDLNLEETYQPRDWSMYVNKDYKATSATVLTKSKLDSWYSKYMNIPNGTIWDLATFQSIYGTNYESLIDNYSFYWLPPAYTNNFVYGITPASQGASYYSNYAFGVRIQISLESDVKFSREINATQTVVSRGMKYTYNIWNIE